MSDTINTIFGDGSGLFMPAENLLDIMRCRIVPAVFTGNSEEDNKANADLFLCLTEEGRTQGFCPVLVEKDIKHYIRQELFGFSDSNEEYPQITQHLIQLAKGNCFSVWIGKLIYNYYLEGAEYDDVAMDSLGLLDPPVTQNYLDRFANSINTKPFLLGEDNSHKPYDFSYENHVFALVPVKEPWEVLAWIPMGGFNWCPDQVHQVALAKGLYEQFGARILYISFSALEYYIPIPITKKEDMDKAAKILIAADSDIYEDYDVVADRILGSHVWSMWWD